MNNVQQNITVFSEILIKQAVRKEKLYDGSNGTFPIDTALRFATEELGEVATAITRERYSSAMDECIDLAHCAFLVWLSIKRELSKDEE